MLKGLGGLGGLGDMAKMMQAAQEMQGKVAELQESFNTINVIGEAGAGLVTATCSAAGDLKALDINPSIFDPSQKEVVEDLILAAIKDAQKKAADRKQAEMKRLYESLGLPADMKLPI
ncbi:MAG TPA: YbaB/EbfC family nucleoid-associated protein [Albidovulum sp.]|uniref:YbaB/EbfC family nucleoid-associated protein n=1 Tax=Albidovulum sp. TaxID=1872424 RepID=UPI002C92DE4F|nr:YbaB/EbfC family nucleoid-associated protein [Albidovulum sp.]